MELKPIDKSWATNKKDIKYLNRDFASLRQALIEFTKTYYSNTYNDFSEASPGMMFIEQAAYVGDILSYYTDAQLKESFINLASNKNNIYQLAQNLGYKPKISTPASVTLTLYQTLPSKYKVANDSGSNFEPDFDYALKINEGMLVGSNSNQNVEFLFNNEVLEVKQNSIVTKNKTYYAKNIILAIPPKNFSKIFYKLFPEVSKSESITPAKFQLY